MIKIAKAREAGEILGREGLSKRVIQLVDEFDGSYKGAMKLAGQLSVIANACTFDEYWDEKCSDGRVKESRHFLSILESRDILKEHSE